MCLKYHTHIFAFQWDYFDDIEVFFMRFWVMLRFTAFGAVAVYSHSMCSTGGDSVEGFFFCVLAAAALVLLVLDIVVMCKAWSNIERFLTYVLFVFLVLLNLTMMLGGGVGAYLTFPAFGQE
eukprot:SAG31_NODE_9598_length_1253_cov_1.039861_2_plen_121_part_01